MDKEEIFQNLTQIFAEKINYSGEFYSLFFIEDERGKLNINFLNKQHYDFILKHLINDILEVVKGEVKFGYLNMKTTPITLKEPLQEEVIATIKPSRIKPKEKVELPTIRNRTFKEIENFMFDEYEKICEEQKELIKREDYLNNAAYIANFGEISFIARLYDWIKKNRDYEED
jgi:hypothetical protein